MRQIHGDAELDRLHHAGVGLIYNDYSGQNTWGFQYNVLHAASCYHLERADTKYDKYFFNTLSEAVNWLKTNRGQEGVNWKRCGTCHAVK